MFHYEKDKYELMAEEECDKAVGEIIKVAERIAEVTDTRFKRNVTNWATFNYWKRAEFVVENGVVTFWHSKYDYHDLHIDTSDLVSSEAIEFAWAAEEMWNERTPTWRKAQEVLDGLDEYDLWDRLDNALDADVEKAFDALNDLMETWIESAEDWYTSEDHMNELREDAA